MNMTHVTIDIYTERFSVALLISVMVHLLVIYGVSFIMPAPANSRHYAALDVILVQKKTEIAPEKPDFFAQATQDGSGQAEPKDKARPATPTIAPFPGPTAELVATPLPPQVAAAPSEPEIESLTTHKPSSWQVEAQPPEPVTPPAEPATDVANDAEQTTVTPEESPPLNNLNLDTPSAIASIQAEIDKKFENYVKKTKRHKYINSSTKESIYANYMVTWRGKIEDTATKIYQAIHQKAAGKLLLDVAIRSNGTIYEIKLIQLMSGSSILEEVARQSVHKAAPFARFPDNIRKECDILHIIRTWEFDPGGSVITR
jgi:protein TonB